MNWKECTYKHGDGRDTGEICVSSFLMTIPVPNLKYMKERNYRGGIIKILEEHPQKEEYVT